MLATAGSAQADACYTWSRTLHSLCTLAQQARNHGFNGILGPGYPDHNDHTHVDHRPSRYRSAPNCGS